MLPRGALQDEVLILANGPSLLGRPWDTVPRERVMILGINQSWRVFAEADAHYSADVDQYLFDNPEAAGFGGRAYYEGLDRRRAIFHSGGWENHGVRVDRHDAVIFGRHPFRKRHRGAHTLPPALREDGGVALKVDPSASAGSSAYIALQLAAASGFEVIWFVGLECGEKKFDGAHGYSDKRKRIPTTAGAWSNSLRHDALWRAVPDDVRARVRVIEPSATQVLDVVPWPWRKAA